MRALSIATRGVISNWQGIALATRGFVDFTREEAIPPLVFALPGRFDITMQWINQRISDVGPIVRFLVGNSQTDTYWDRITNKVGGEMDVAMPLRQEIIDLQDKIIKLRDDLQAKE